MMVYGMEASMGWRFQADLPECIVGVEYAENNHHIKLINKWGQELKLDADHMVKYTCDECDDQLFAKSNHGVLKCPYCGGEMQPVWGAAQLCFMPEQESDFAHCVEPEAENEDTDPHLPAVGKEE